MLTSPNVLNLPPLLEHRNVQSYGLTRSASLSSNKRDQYTVVKSWDSRAARDNLAFLVKDFHRLKRQKKEQFDVGEEIIAIERIEGETNALWGMWKSSSASGSRLSVPPEVWISHFSTL